MFPFLVLGENSENNVMLFIFLKRIEETLVHNKLIHYMQY